MSHVLNGKPLCEECDKPTTVLELVKPKGRQRSEGAMLPKPCANPEILEKIESAKSENSGKVIVNLVGHRNDQARFEHEEWLLSEDADILSHSYFLVRDCIYSIVRMK